MVLFGAGMLGLGAALAAPRPYYPPPAPVYVAPPVVYAPPPVVYAPPPVYAAPVYAAPVLDAVPASPVYQVPNGAYCREYQSNAVIGGVSRPVFGTACQQPDGSWRAVR